MNRLGTDERSSLFRLAPQWLRLPRLAAITRPKLEYITSQYVTSRAEDSANHCSGFLKHRQAGKETLRPDTLAHFKKRRRRALRAQRNYGVHLFTSCHKAKKRSSKSLHPWGWREDECWLTSQVLSWSIFLLDSSSTYPALRVARACPTCLEGSKGAASPSQGGKLFFSERKEKKKNRTQPAPEVSGLAQHCGHQAASERHCLFCFDSNDCLHGDTSWLVLSHCQLANGVVVCFVAASHGSLTRQAAVSGTLWPCL